jgi:hypothetical protein
LATSDSNDLKSSENLVISETSNMKRFGGSPSTKEKATKENEKDETSSELKQAIRGLIRETTCPSLQLFVAAGLDRIEVEARRKRKDIKKDKKSKDKKLKDKKSKDKSLLTSETTNDLQEITIEKLVRDETSESLQLLIDAAYGIIQIEVGESMEEKKERKKREKEDRKMVLEMKHRIGKKQKEGMDERIDGTKGATTNASEEVGPAQNTQFKARAKGKS